MPRLKKFKLLAGAHVGPDFRAEKLKVLNRVTGEEQEIDRYPSKKYATGDTVYDEDDLANKLGADKFQPMGEEDVPTYKEMEDRKAKPGDEMTSGNKLRKQMEGREVPEDHEGAIPLNATPTVGEVEGGIQPAPQTPGGPPVNRQTSENQPKPTAGNQPARQEGPAKKK